jgi:heme exporter protein D
MSEFLNMGGYAVFVWSSFGISFVVLLLNVIVPVIRRKQLIRDVSGHIKRKR